MGATKEKIARDCEKCDFHDYVYVDTFEEAMNLAVEMAEPGRCSASVSGVCKLGHVPEL